MVLSTTMSSVAMAKKTQIPPAALGEWKTAECPLPEQWIPVLQPLASMRQEKTGNAFAKSQKVVDGAVKETAKNVLE